ncbi:MAG: glycine reductase [Thermomicrobiales bacterium]|nr:glycine reductase [Thermomicrobiales bacterium]
MEHPVISAASYVLCHTPQMVRYGSKPSREIAKDGQGVADRIGGALRSFDDAVAYPPNQVFIGNTSPADLRERERPWWRHPVADASRFSSWGEIMPEIEFLGLLKAADQFDVVHLRADAASDIQQALKRHPLGLAVEAERVIGVPPEKFDHLTRQPGSLPLYLDGYSGPVGCVLVGHDEDTNLVAHILLENLATKASAALAVRHLIAEHGLDPASIPYVLNCGEEAVGDRYQRGGGSLSKAIAEQAGLTDASGSDTKAFCCAPAHSIVEGAALVQARVFDNVLVVGGGSLAKLGMKFRSHVEKEMPILEDVLAGVAILIAPDDGHSPLIRLDTVGRHRVASGSSQQSVMQDLVRDPLRRVGWRFTDIDLYATEMHNPEVTEPSGSGNVPDRNYKMIASLAALDGEIGRDEIAAFVAERGTLGFSPTQGHIAAAVPLLGHALRDLKEGRSRRVFFLAKGSLFLGKMTNMSDGMSFAIEGREKPSD